MVIFLLSTLLQILILIASAAFGGSNSDRGNTGPFWVASGE